MLRKTIVYSLPRLIMNKTVGILKDPGSFHFLVGPRSPVIVVSESAVVGIELPFRVRVTSIYRAPILAAVSLYELSSRVWIKVRKAENFDVWIRSK
jgi:hypothetical protein